MIRKLYLVLVLAISFILFSQVSYATWISISPLKYELAVNPWETKDVTVKVTNNEETAVTLYTSKEDFTSSDDTWTPKFIKPQDQTNDEYSLSNWIKIEWDNLTLAKWETREIKITVTVPPKWEPGWHYWAIFFAAGWAGGWQVAVIQRLWVLLLINVSWDIKVSWWLSGFQVWLKQDNKFIEKDVFDNFPIIFDTKFKNEWNTHLKPTWKIELVDESWDVLKNIWKETLTSPAWAFVWEKMVDYIPVNDWGWNVLPKSERRFESIWEWFWYQILNEDWTKSVKFKNLTDYYADKASEKKSFLNFWESIHSRTVNKKITANLTLNYEWKDKEKKEFKETKTFQVKYNEQYVWLNYFMIIFSLILVLGLAYYFIIHSPKAKETLKKQLMEEMKKNSWQK